MSSMPSDDLKQIVHPFLFILKEGKERERDLFDYSLMMLHVNCLEVFRTPRIGCPELSLKPRAVCTKRATLPDFRSKNDLVHPKI